MTLGEFAQLLAAAGVGGIIAQYVSRSGERRQARGNVRDALSEVEGLRWVRSLEEDDWLAFGAALRSFVSSALVAGMPRRLVDRYERMAKVSRFVTSRHLKNGTPPGRIAIESEVSDCIEFTHQLVSDYLWRPLWARMLLGRRLKRLDKLEEVGRKTEHGSALGYSYWSS